MKKFKVSTLIKSNYMLTINKEYVLGKISGIGYMVCEKNEGGIIYYIQNKGYVYENEFTIDEYDNFINIIEELYPGLCIFNYQNENESR